MWLLSRRWGRLSDRIGPRLLMGCGPLVAGAGLILMGRLSADVDYVTDLLPAVIVFALGLSATVAPLTNTVLSAVPQHNAGVASGVNNQVARVAGLLAIAVLGAVVSAQYKDVLRENAASVRGALRYEQEVLAGGRGQPAPVREAVQDASVSAYRLGLGVGGVLVIVGGVVSLAGIVNPRRAERECAEERTHGPARLQQPCVEPQRLPTVRLPQRAPAAAPE
jgi:MFS family permease